MALRRKRDRVKVFRKSGIPKTCIADCTRPHRGPCNHYLCDVHRRASNAQIRIWKIRWYSSLETANARTQLLLLKAVHPARRGPKPKATHPAAQGGEG